MKRIRTDRDDREFASSVRALLGGPDEATLLERLRGARIPPPYALHAKAVYAKIPPAELVRQLAARTRFAQLGDSPFAFTFQKGRDVIPFAVASAPAASPQVGIVLAVCKSREWSLLRRALQGRYPSLIPVLLSQAELVRTVLGLRNFIPSTELVVTEFSAKERLQAGAFRRRRSIREWTFEELDQVLALVEERQQFLTSLNVQFSSAELFRETWKIRKDGEVALNGGFNLANQAIIQQMARIGDRKLSLFAGRGLRDANYRPRPLSIEFARPVLDDVAAVRQLVRTLGRFPHSMHAVMHGNPYAHVRLTDMLDGSSIEVWAVEPDKIALIPGLKASGAAFNRLVQYIFDTFREGTLLGTYGEKGAA